MRPWLWVLCAGAASVMACSTSVSPIGQYTCEDGEACPAGFECVNELCVSDGSGGGGGPFPDARGGGGGGADARGGGGGGDPCEGTTGPDGQCFEAFLSSSNYAQAIDGCNARGGHLATISGGREMRAVENEMPGAAWIGLAGGSGAFAWVTGEPFTFDDWLPGQPNEEIAAACVQATNAGWRVLPCGDTSPYVCERND